MKFRNEQILKKKKENDSKYIKAFTIVELIIVIAVISILAAVLIPVFTGVLTDANVSVDKQNISTLNKELQIISVDNEIKNEIDLENALKDIYGDRMDIHLTPKSISLGNHYWYNVKTKKVELRDVEYVLKKQNQENKTEFNDGSLRLFGIYYLLDRSGSEIVNVISKFENFTSEQDYFINMNILEKIMVKTEDKDNQLSILLYNKISKTTLITNYGSFRFDNYESINNVMFQNNISIITSSLTIYNPNNKEYYKTCSSKQNPIANVSEMYIPDTVKTVDSFGLYFKEDNTVLLYTNYETEEQLINVFKAFSSNAIIVMNNKKYYISEDKLINENNEEISNLKTTTPITDFTIGYDNTNIDSNKIYLYETKTESTIYVACDLINFKLTAREETFVPSDSSAKVVTWESNSDLLLIDKVTGKVTITEQLVNSNESEFEITATAVIGGHQEKIKVCIIKINNASLKLNGNDVFIKDKVQIQYYGNTLSYPFENLSLSITYSGLNIKCEANVEYETTGNVFTITDNVLYLNLDENQNIITGSQNLKIKLVNNIGEVFDHDLIIEVLDYSSSPIEPKFENIDDYLYRVGNSSEVKIENLFTLNEQKYNNGTLTVKIYDVLQTSGDQEKIEIETNDNNSFSAIYNTTISKSNWNNETIKFNGNGIALIQITYQDTINNEIIKYIVEVIVEVVNGKNIYSYSDLQGSNNNILLQNIEFPENGSFSLQSGKTLWGNGFEIDVTKGSINKNGIIELNNATLDNAKVIGAIYQMYQPDSFQPYSSSTVVAVGNSIVSNCYISNCRSPLRVNAKNNTEVQVINTTLDGGRYANIDLRNGVLILDDVTTIGLPKEGVVGLGIVVCQDANSNASVVVNNKLNQYNWVSKNDRHLFDNNLQKYFDLIFNKELSYLHYEYNDTIYVNPGIILLNETKDISGNGIPGNYSRQAVTYMGLTRYIWTYDPNKYQLEEQYFHPNEYYSNTQGAFSPTFTFDYPEQYNELTKAIELTVEKGQSYSLDPDFLTVKKFNKDYIVNIIMNNQNYYNSNITFSEEGEYIIYYTVYDPYNYDKFGFQTGSIIYTKSVKVNVSVYDKDIKETEFTFIDKNKNEYSSKTINVNNETYIMPDVSNNIDGLIESKIIDNQTIYYPIVKSYCEGNAVIDSIFRYYPIFSGVSIKKYTNNNDDYIIYNQFNTKEMIEEIKWLKGGFDGGNGYDSYIYNQLCDGVCLKTNAIKYTGGNGIEASGQTLVLYMFEYNGQRYNYYICYEYSKDYMIGEGSSCVAEGTLVTLKNGEKVKVEDLQGNEQLLIWNFETGKYDIANIAYIVNHNNQRNETKVTTLYFSDGTNIEIIGEHGFYDVTLNKWIYINNDANNYINHKFMKYSSNSNKLIPVTLINSKETIKQTGVYEVVTYNHLNAFTNDLLSVSGYTGPLLNIFEVDKDTMAYNAIKKQQDIKQYGLFTYNEFKNLVSKEVFDLYNAKYLKVAIEKELITWDDIYKLIEIYESNNIIVLNK